MIPPCISNWKNAKGYTIPLDKRLAADGRGVQKITINDNFARLSEALFVADRHARSEVKIRYIYALYSQFMNVVMKWRQRLWKRKRETRKSSYVPWPSEHEMNEMEFSKQTRAVTLIPVVGAAAPDRAVIAMTIKVSRNEMLLGRIEQSSETGMSRGQLKRMCNHY
jgi:hypothetical protein